MRAIQVISTGTRRSRRVALLSALMVTMVAPVAAAVDAEAADAPPVHTATLVRATPTSVWLPGSPDPSGVAWMPGTDQLVVVDSEVEEVTGAGWNNVNVWFAQRDGTATSTGTLWGTSAAQFAGSPGFSKEPTGVAFDPDGNRLFVSDDSALKIFVITPGPDTAFANADDVVSAIDLVPLGVVDPEDPTYDPVTGSLFFLEGTGSEVYRVDPVDGTFGNGDDVVTQFDVGYLGPIDFEGLARDPYKGTLYVGARTTKQIFEVNLDGSLVRTIDASGIAELGFISGLEVAPSSTREGHTNLWIVDRRVDNAYDAAENDGMLFEVSAPDVGPPPPNAAPTVDAGADQTISLPAGTATLAGTATDDGVPIGGTLTTTWSQVDGPAPVAFGNASAPATAAAFTAGGTYTLRLTASDGELTTTDDLVVTVNVTRRAIDVAAMSVNGAHYWFGAFGTASVTVRDASNAVVRGATVTGTWYQGNRVVGSRSGTTSWNGVASIWSPLLWVPRGTILQFCVTSLSGTNLTWDTGLFQPTTKTDCAAWTTR